MKRLWRTVTKTMGKCMQDPPYWRVELDHRLAIMDVPELVILSR